MNLYLLQGLLDDKFSSPDVLVGKKCPNLVEVELGGEVGGDGGDDVAHGEAPRVELLKDLLPVALQVAPCWKLTCNPLNYKSEYWCFTDEEIEVIRQKMLRVDACKNWIG